MVLNNSSTSIGVSVAVGSSIMIIFAPRYSVLMISTLCFSPTVVQQGLHTVGQVAGAPQKFPLRRHSQGNIFRHRQVAGQHKMLMYHPYAHLYGVFRTVHHNRFTPKENLSAVRWMTPYKIFIDVDLPAPFSPTIAWTSPLLICSRSCKIEEDVECARLFIQNNRVYFFRRIKYGFSHE